MKRLFLILWPLTIAAIVLGADLNVSGEKKVTLGSEIKRGSDAVFDLGSGVDLLKFLQSYFDLISRNKQASTDTDGFLLGAKYKMWVELDIDLDLDLRAINEGNVIKMAEEDAAQWFQEFRKQQQQIGISDAQFAEAVGIKEEVFIDRIREWESGPPARPHSVTEAQQMAVAKYPALAEAGSALNLRFLDEVRRAKAENPSLFEKKNWPLLLARKCSQTLAASNK